MNLSEAGTRLLHLFLQLLLIQYTPHFERTRPPSQLSIFFWAIRSLEHLRDGDDRVTNEVRAIPYDEPAVALGVRGKDKVTQTRYMAVNGLNRHRYDTIHDLAKMGPRRPAPLPKDIF